MTQIWPKFGDGPIWPKNGFLVRRMLIRKNLEFSPRPFVTAFLEIHPLLFSETLQLVRTQKGGKNVPSAFLIIFTVLAILAKNCPKWAFLAQSDKKIFLRTTHQIFLIFCSKHSLWSRKKNDVFAFFGKFQKWPFLVKIDPNLA